MKVLILFDAPGNEARPDELDSLVQVEMVEAALTRLGHQVVRLAFSLDTQWVLDCLEREHPEIVFNLVESVEGNGCLHHIAPAMLESRGIHFTGGGSTALQLTSDKLAAKRVMHAAGLPTAPWHAGEGQGWQGLAPGEKEPLLGSKVIIKSVSEHASLGLDDHSVFKYDSELRLQAEIINRRVRLGGSAFAECFVSGREFNIGLLGGGNSFEFLPPAELLFLEFPPEKPKLISYKAKWEVNSFEYQHTQPSYEFPESDHDLIDEMKRLAAKCWWLFSLKSYARVDFRVDQAGKPWILEVNLNPCLEKEAGFARAAKRVGWEFDPLIAHILDVAARQS